MNDFVMPLYPEAGEKRPLTNLYLDHHIRQEGRTAGRAFVFANFVVRPAA
jgi:hypothetical protein